MAKGLFQKYQLTKTDGRPVDADGIYFVLKLNSSDPVHAQASRLAVKMYATTVAQAPRLRKLSEDLWKLVRRLEAGKEVDDA